MYEHVWYTPADCAAMLAATKHGGAWRAACPAHGGENGSSLSITELKDRFGNPATFIHCHAHNCDIRDICAAMGIELRNLFSIRPDYAQSTRNAPRARSPRIDRLKSLENPSTDEIAQIMLEEFIVSDPEFILTCTPAREQLWALAQASPKARSAFTRALRDSDIGLISFWENLRREMEG